MPTIINPSTLSSIIKYMQSISLTLGIPANKLPDKLTKFANSINNFFNKIWDYIPHLPDFDVRVRVVLLSFAIPALLDLLFTWFTSTLLENIFHLFDIAASFAFLFEIAYVVMSKGKTTIGVFIVIPLCIIYGIIRLIIIIRKYKLSSKDSEPLTSIVDRIKNFYMKGIIPGINSDHTEEEMSAMLEKYNESYVFKIVKPSFLNIGFILISMTLLSLIIAYSFDAFGHLDVKPFIRISLTIICGLLLIILLIVLFMIVFPCLRSPFVSFRKFVRRYGVKLLLLIIDFLYIPIGTTILENFRYEPNNCGDGFYRSYSIDTSSYLDFFLDHNTVCQPCSIVSNITNATLNLFDASTSIFYGEMPNYYNEFNSSCSAACFNNIIYYSTSSPHLQLNHDILPTILPLIVFSFLVIIIGQPVLTLYVVLHNKSIAWSIPIFGKTAEIKWSTLVSKLSTTGLFNFYMFKYNWGGWAIFTSIQKLVFVVLTEIAERVNLSITYAILVLYVFVFILYLSVKPFTFVFNNVLEIILSFGNAALTLVPICSIYGKKVPSFFSIPISVVICILPIIAIPYAFCRKSEIEPEPDPGTTYDDEGKVVEPTIPNQPVYLHLIDLMAIWQVVDLEKNSTTIYPASYDDNDDIKLDNQNENPQSYDYNNNYYNNNNVYNNNYDNNYNNNYNNNYYMQNSNNDEEMAENDYIIIGRDDLLSKVNDMYQLIDTVCDATTTTDILSMIKIAVIISAACSGWFFGAIIGRRILYNNLVC